MACVLSASITRGSIRLASGTNHLKSLLLFTAVCLLSGWQIANAVEVIEITVDVSDGRYRVFGQSKIAAPPEFVFSILMDYDNFHKIANGIDETKFLPSDESGDLLAYTRYKSCVLVFCKTIEKVERIDSHPHDLIHVQAIAERSDFVFSEARWIIEAAGDETLLTYEAEFEADFWIPPFIGPWAVRRKLVHTAELIGMRIEWMHERGLTLAQVRE